MSEENNWVEIISAFAIGVGVGAALGILFAPKAGEELRGELYDNAREGLNQAVSKGREWAGQAQEAATDTIDKAKKQAVSKGREWADRAQQVASDAADQVRDAVESGKQGYREAKSGS
jgi:gas vesicle protein